MEGFRGHFRDLCDFFTQDAPANSYFGLIWTRFMSFFGISVIFIKKTWIFIVANIILPSEIHSERFPCLFQGPYMIGDRFGKNCFFDIFSDFRVRKCPWRNIHNFQQIVHIWTWRLRKCGLWLPVSENPCPNMHNFLNILHICTLPRPLPNMQNSLDILHI